MSICRTQSGDVAVWNTQTRHMEEFMPKYHIGGALQVQVISDTHFFTLERMGVSHVVTEEKVSFGSSTAKRDSLLLWNRWIVRR